MMKKIKIRKGDKVIVVTGKYKGTSGEVLNVIPEKNKVLVRGVNIVKRHTKPTQASKGGIIEKEMPITISNVAFMDEKESKATKLGYKFLEDGRKVRYSKLTGDIIDT